MLGYKLTAEPQQISDEIARAVLNHIIESRELPDLREIVDREASAIVDKYKLPAHIWTGGSFMAKSAFGEEYYRSTNLVQAAEDAFTGVIGALAVAVDIPWFSSEAMEQELIWLQYRRDLMYEYIDENKVEFIYGRGGRDWQTVAAFPLNVRAGALFRVLTKLFRESHSWMWNLRQAGS
jgi:hypothetical protein